MRMKKRHSKGLSNLLKEEAFDDSKKLKLS
jgi:hypothetical protein